MAKVKYLALAELELEVIKLLDNHTSKEEPKYDYTFKDKQLVLSRILNKSLEKSNKSL